MTEHPNFGAALAVDWAGGTSYVAIGQVRDIDGPSISRDSIDVSSQDSTNGWREFLPGLADAGEWSFDVLFDPTSTMHAGGEGTGMLGDFNNDGCTLAAWQLTLKICGGTAIWTADGFLTGFTQHVAFEDALKADVTVKISGKPVLTVT